MKVHPSVTDKRVFEACERMREADGSFDATFCLTCGAQRDFKPAEIIDQCELCGQFTVYDAIALMFTNLNEIDPIGIKATFTELKVLIKKIERTTEAHFKNKITDPRQVIRACLFVAWRWLRDIPDAEYELIKQDLEDEITGLNHVFNKSD